MKIDKMGHGSATGKIILMGEHAVVYGEPAIAFPFTGTLVSVTVELAAAMELNCSYYEGPLSIAPQHLQNIKEVIVQTLTLLRHPNASLKISITSSIPPERGMGSSAAVAVAIVRALADYFDASVTSKTLLSLVNQGEQIAHGNPSGIDAAATSGKEPLFFVKGKAFEPFPMNMTEAYLIVADTGIKGQTREVVADVASLLQKDSQDVGQQLTELGRLTKMAKQAILTNNQQQLGFAMNLAQAQLKALSVSNEKLDQLIKVANENGALGAKLTGGGRGGCMIALANSKAKSERIAQALLNNGAAKTWIQSLGVK